MPVDEEIADAVQRERDAKKDTADRVPVYSYRQAAPYLRRPFDVHAVQFRALEGTKGERLNCAAYVTARTVTDRLNLVCPDLWEEVGYEPVPSGLRCALKIDGLTRFDVGWAANTATAMGLKALYSDAFKRAAVKFGVGVSLYALPRMTLLVSERDAWARPVKDKKDQWGNQLYKYGIEPKGFKTLRARYDLWLQSDHGFGAPLSHGHMEGSADPEDETLATEPTEAPEVTTEGDIKTLKEAAKGLLFPTVRMCFVAAGLPAPERKVNCFVDVPRANVAELAARLKNTARPT